MKDAHDAATHGAHPRVVAVAGFMAAGKTTVARALARRLACRFVDLDELITAREGATPRAIIDGRGETHFREVETAALRLALEGATPPDSSPGSVPLVIALGGGAWTLERNRALVAERGGVCVWLDAPFDLCWQRINDAEDRGARPLARERDKALKLYEERRASYGLATLRVEVSERDDPEALAARVASLLAP